MTTREQAHRWVNERTEVTLRTGLGHEHATGRVYAYADRPQIAIETDTGERIWWIADMAEETPPTTTTTPRWRVTLLGLSWFANSPQCQAAGKRVDGCQCYTFDTWREAYGHARAQVEKARQDFLKQLLAEVSAMDDPIALSADPAGTTPVELARDHAQSTPAAGPVGERGASGTVRRRDDSVPAEDAFYPFLEPAALRRRGASTLGPMPTPEAVRREVTWR